MRKMFYPESVMVYGVSDSPNNLGRNTVENLERFGFQRSVYMVSREGGELNARKIFQLKQEEFTGPLLGQHCCVA